MNKADNEPLFRCMNTKAVWHEFIGAISEGKTSCYDKALIKALDKEVESYPEQYFTQINKDEIVWRARGIEGKPEKTEFYTHGIYPGYNESNSRETPLLLNKAGGRADIKGQSVFYCASDEETAISEIKPKLNQSVSLAKFKMADDMQVLDVYTDRRLKQVTDELNWAKLFTEIMACFCLPILDEKEYIAAQVISDYIRKMGVDGIKYRSAFTNGVNYAIFNCHPSKIDFISSRTVMNKGINYRIWDFENERHFDTHDVNEDIYDGNIAEDIVCKYGLRNEKL